MDVEEWKNRPQSNRKKIPIFLVFLIKNKAYLYGFYAKEKYWKNVNKEGEEKLRWGNIM